MMKKYKCGYSQGWRLNIGDKWEMKIEAANPKEAYEKFIEKVGEYPQKEIVDINWLKSEIFDDHLEAAKQRIHEKLKADRDQSESEETKEVEQNKNLSTDELLSKIIKNQNKQTEVLYKIRWVIIATVTFLFLQWMALKMKLGL